MGWRDLLQRDDETVVLPWVGGRELRTWDRVFKLEGKFPREFGWYEFKVKARSLVLSKEADYREDALRDFVTGYLVGDRLVLDGVRVETDPVKLVESTEPIHLVERGLDRFVRISAGRPHEEGPLIFRHQEFPLGPEDAVTRAYQDRKPTLDAVSGVVPGLDAAFRFESWRRAEAERMREVERLRLEEEEREKARLERQAQIAEQLGTGIGRREMAELDFGEAARAALKIGGAEYLDHRESTNAGEMVVQFRFQNRRFECVCDAKTLRIVDSGICLVDHETGVKGDEYFTLESFPAVLREAIATRRLVVWRRVDEDYEGDWD